MAIGNEYMTIAPWTPYAINTGSFHVGPYYGVATPIQPSTDVYNLACRLNSIEYIEMLEMKKRIASLEEIVKNLINALNESSKPNI